jgi:transposase
LSAAGLDAAIALDEGRFGLKTWVRRRWCLRGERPPWVVSDAYEWVWVYVAVEPTTGRCVVCYLPGVDSACLASFLQAVAAAFPGQRVGVVLDNAPSHTSGAVAWPAHLVPLRLPPYSPELNPVEPVFRLLRQALANRVFADLAALEEALTEALRAYWDEPPRLQRLTGFPWWVDGTTSIATSS